MARILIVGGSGSGKGNSLFNLKYQQPDIDKIYLYAKDSYKAKYQFLFHKRESTGLNLFSMGLFGAAHGWGWGQNDPPPPPSLKSVTYILQIMKLGAVITYLKKIQKICKSGDTPLDFC